MKCKHAGCGNPAQTRGYCRHHYKIAWAQERFGARPRCKFKGCDRPMHGHGLCNEHRTQQLRGIALRPLGILGHRWSPPPKTCEFPKCGRRYLALGFCKQHYRQHQRGEKLKPIRKTKKPVPLAKRLQALIRRRANLPILKGRAVFLSYGYPSIDIWKDGRSERFRIHRLVMEKKIGRKLTTNEVVHHIDHDKLNCLPKNLLLFATHNAHMKVCKHGRPRKAAI